MNASTSLLKVKGDEPPGTEEMSYLWFISSSVEAPDTQIFRGSGPKQEVPPT